MAGARFNIGNNMALTEEQIVELAAVKVQKEVLEKVENFTDGVMQNVHNLQLELKDTNQYNSAVMAQLNEVRGDVKHMEPSIKKVEELWVLFCKNGYMKRFNKLAETVEKLKDRPGDRALKSWDKIKWTILGGFITALFGGATAFLLGLV